MSTVNLQREIRCRRGELDPRVKTFLLDPDLALAAESILDDESKFTSPPAASLAGDGINCAVVRTFGIGPVSRDDDVVEVFAIHVARRLDGGAALTDRPQPISHTAARPRKAKKPTTSVTVVTKVPEAIAGSMSK